jgi:hypothetical protein
MFATAPVLSPLAKLVRCRRQFRHRATLAQAGTSMCIADASLATERPSCEQTARSQLTACSALIRSEIDSTYVKGRHAARVLALPQRSERPATDATSFANSMYQGQAPFGVRPHVANPEFATSTGKQDSCNPGHQELQGQCGDGPSFKAIRPGLTSVRHSEARAAVAKGSQVALAAALLCTTP